MPQAFQSRPIRRRYLGGLGKDPADTERRYLAQRRMKGVGEALLGAPDLVNMALNAGIRDVGSFAGMKPDDVYQLPMASQSLANLLSPLAKSGIVGDEEVTPEARQKGANQQVLFGMLPTGIEDVPQLATMGLVHAVPSLIKAAKRLGAPAEELPKVAKGLGVLPGAPSHVKGPVPKVVEAAEDYAKSRGLDLKRQSEYAKADYRRGRYIAKAYEKMPHAPDDPKVRASYEALAKETMAQWDAMMKAGAKIDFIKPGMADPYPGGPTQALRDLRDNNHLWVFPTESGFGSLSTITDNPLLKPTGIVHGGHPMLVNDVFRAVHDYFGHGMEGANFGARGEENAWRAHKRLFSPEAMPALTSETRGQNSWVNFGPYGEANRANQLKTVYADQKTGVMPPWTTRESGLPISYRAQQVALPLTLGAGLTLSGSTERHRKNRDER
jgi:hypothetical protein